MRPVQRFSDDYLASTREVSADEVVNFLDDFRQLHAPVATSRLISMRVPDPLLAAFKRKCALAGVRYQTQIKLIMTGWLTERDKAPK